MKKILLLLIMLTQFSVFAQPANDNCGSATSLTVNAPLLCGQNTLNATTQAWEFCAASGGGVTPRTVWYSFTATATTHILDIVRTNTVNCNAQLSVYGPNSACLPGGGSAILSCLLLNGDPGVYTTLTGLTIGANYKIQYNGNDCGGGNDRNHIFCIGIYTVATNNTSSTGTIIDACGTNS